ncbi:MAG: hypothetical protein B7Y43_15985 [Sphingomonas sp. 28-62-20]|uniref:glycosyltransferase family 2 protein n=1 Tax=Sphingomonas sp. 28-62-20 TaxID=1970433 RepID=UPI000BD3BE37|nr:MAG: hypothetical protein B7Y43_15985 [Sphingomonas sp. 28-62-20]
METLSLVSTPEISVVIPCYNEEENVAAIAAAVIVELEPITDSFDIIIIDNASTDRTVEIARSLCRDDGRIKLIANARNFGQMRSPTHAIFQAGGRAIIGICADFEDPPSLIPQFVERWRAGTQIVLGVSRAQPTSRLHGWLRQTYYRFTERFGDYAVIPNATGFGLYDRKVVRAIESLREPEPFFRGMLVETGYSIETITYDRATRRGGRSSNNFFTLLDFALSSLASFSKKLVRLPLYVGVSLGFLAGLMILATPLVWLARISLAGWLFACALEVQIALLFVFLGLMGDQLRLVSERTRQTPLVFESERLNFPGDY